MSLFPGSHAQVYYNEAGEPLGWDYPSYDDAPFDDDDWYAQNYEEEPPSDLEPGECLEKGLHGESGSGIPGTTADWWSPITDSYEDGHPQFICDYCGDPFWVQW